MNRPPFAFLPAALALAACAAPAVSPGDAPVPQAGTPAASAPASGMAAAVSAPAGHLSLREAAETITAPDVYARIEFLASDLLKGRDTPSEGLNVAAQYLVNQHRLFGLEPAGENGTYFQWWPYPLRRLNASAARLDVSGGGGPVSLALGRDFFTAGGTAQPVSGGLVYAGTGDAELGEGTMRDRVVVFTLPGRFNRDWRAARGRQRSAAERAGALAVVHVLDETWTADSIAKYGASSRQGTRTLGGTVAYPQLFVTREGGRRIFAAARMETDPLWRRASTAGFQPVPLPGITASAGVPVEALDEGRAPNVVAVLRGSDPVLRDEYVVISAHMDHVGVGAPDATGDSIYNGADDDASGTTGLLEVAQAFASLSERPKRSIVFLHVSGEEKGLLGSQWYSEHPTVPLDRIVANINVDMIGRNSPDSVVVIGKDYSSLGGVANRIAAAHPELRLTLADDIWPEERFFFRSDHFNFARKEVPAIFFFSGVHEDYHRPSDEVEKIDADKAARISRIVFYIANEIANDPQRPRWDPAGLAEVRRMTR